MKDNQAKADGRQAVFDIQQGTPGSGQFVNRQIEPEPFQDARRRPGMREPVAWQTTALEPAVEIFQKARQAA